MEIRGRLIGAGQPCYIVAEIGINHNGDIEIAKDLMHAAKEAGADAVKFQMRILTESIPEHMKDRPKNTPWGDMTYYEYKQHIELSPEVYSSLLYPLAGKLGLHMGTSVWGRRAAHLAANMIRDESDLDSVFDFIKLPSALISDETSLHHTATRGLPFFWSTGAHAWHDVYQAKLRLEMYGFNNWGVLHCNSMYPTPNDHLNLRVIPHWINYFRPQTVGYSGHETGLATTVAAVALGAQVVERHITLDRAMWGSDQAASVEPQGFKRLVRDIRAVEAALGSSEKIVYPEELAKRKELSP